VLVENDVRPYLRRLVELEFPDSAVLSMRELTPELVPQPVGMISLSGAGMFG
jgi:type III secretion protein V